MAPVRDTRWAGRQLALTLLAVTLAAVGGRSVAASALPTDSYRLTGSSAATAPTKETVSASTSSTSTDDATINRCRAACLAKNTYTSAFGRPGGWDRPGFCAVSFPSIARPMPALPRELRLDPVVPELAIIRLGRQASIKRQASVGS
uniref:Uncharacterized protein n=1 Tax=Anopheles merus TaxID=30066 RepID=A0A182VB97_ANOME